MVSVNSSSCPPSSVIVVCGSELGRGKKTERLREWMRVCRRLCVGGGVELLAVGKGTSWEAEEVREMRVVEGGA